MNRSINNHFSPSPPSPPTGRVDSSGIQLHYTPRPRPYDAGIMELGLEYTAKMAIPPAMPSFTLAGYCIPECTALVRGRARTGSNVCFVANAWIVSIACVLFSNAQSVSIVDCCSECVECVECVSCVKCVYLMSKA